MREQLWEVYHDLKFRFFYYSSFLKLFSCVNWIISCFLTLMSISSIALWGIWGKYPMIWSILICVSQLIQAIFPKLPYNDLIVVTKLMVSSMDSLLLSIEKDWLTAEYVRDYTNQEYLDCIDRYQTRYYELVSQFYSGVYLPELNYLHKKAEKNCENYFHRKYFID